MKIRIEYEVPDSNYCWLQIPPHSICSYFDNERGAYCDLFREHLIESKEVGVLKTAKCLKAGKETP